MILNWRIRMNNLNSILLEGVLKEDPLYRVTPKGTPVCTFSIASNRYSRIDGNLQEEVSFFNIEAWSKLADMCNEKGHKGRGLRVVGRLKEDRWTDHDRKQHSKVVIVAEHVEFRPEVKEEGGE
jgi:single-strand DNA-binding protein